MYSFSRNASIDLTTYSEPPIADRTGPPLSQGFLFTLISMVVGSRVSPETLQALTTVDPELWYHGQALEALLDEVARSAADGPYQLGRAVYFMLPTQMRALGINSPETFMAGLPLLWTQVTRGDSGWYRTQLVAPGVARIEMAQPYNCHFEAGALVGFIDGLGCEEVSGKHLGCMRSGAPHCTIEVTWSAAEKGA